MLMSFMIYMKEKYFLMNLDLQMLVWEYLWSKEVDMPFTVTIRMEILLS